MYFRRYDLGGKDSVDATAFAYAEKKKPMSNYDRLISKTPEELAEWLSCNCTGDGYGNGAEDWLDWLKQEVRE